eukprot:1139265-Pelagomonas_calceolata.AAC.4
MAPKKSSLQPRTLDFYVLQAQVAKAVLYVHLCMYGSCSSALQVGAALESHPGRHPTKLDGGHAHEC